MTPRLRARRDLSNPSPNAMVPDEKGVPMRVLGIETSCDETAAAVVDAEGRILADEVLSQQADHRPFGGIVLEVAARSHLDHLDAFIRRALQPRTLLRPIHPVAPTRGPGLLGALVGVTIPKTIAAVRRFRFSPSTTWKATR